jgi:hypothetical protein
MHIDGRGRKHDEKRSGQCARSCTSGLDRCPVGPSAPTSRTRWTGSRWPGLAHWPGNVGARTGQLLPWGYRRSTSPDQRLEVLARELRPEAGVLADLSADDRRVVLGWRESAVGVFELRGRIGSTIRACNLVDDLDLCWLQSSSAAECLRKSTKL